MFRARSQRSWRKHRHWKIVPYFCPSSLVRLGFTFGSPRIACRFRYTSSDEILGGTSQSESNVENWCPKTFSCTPDWFHVSSGNLLSRLSNERELSTIPRSLETWDNLPLQFESISWNYPELFIEIICSCICCNWEVSCWIVSWFSLNFLHRELINLLYLRSLHFSHFVLTSNLRISKSFFFS